MKAIFLGLAVAFGLAAAAFLFFQGGAAPETAAGANVTVVDGRQIVRIRAKGGYAPATSVVKAGMPTTLRFETGATFDCSSALVIPSLGISRNLPPSGETDIDVGMLTPGTLQGSCAMGMYRFAVRAE